MDYLIGDPSKARLNLSWEPEIKFDQLCEEMVKADIELLRAGPSRSGL